MRGRCGSQIFDFDPVGGRMSRTSDTYNAPHGPTGVTLAAAGFNIGISTFHRDSCSEASCHPDAVALHRHFGAHDRKLRALRRHLVGAHQTPVATPDYQRCRKGVTVPAPQPSAGDTTPRPVPSRLAAPAALGCHPCHLLSPLLSGGPQVKASVVVPGPVCAALSFFSLF